MEETRRAIYDFCIRNPFGAVATASKIGEPSIAAVFIFAKPDFTFNFLTRTKTQKDKDITENPLAALEMVNDITFETVQLRGNVQRIDGPEEIVDLVNLFRAANDVGQQGAAARGETGPDVARWVPPIEQVKRGEYVLFKVVPTWARYRHYNADASVEKGFTELEYRAE